MTKVRDMHTNDHFDLQHTLRVSSTTSHFSCVVVQVDSAAAGGKKRLLTNLAVRVRVSYE
jgi:hypothetical protein